ncbi:MAG: glycoside hydrolase, partial [Bacteroidetes bacterium SW_10_40_5]
KAKGLKVMLKPHLWIGGNGWPGSLTFKKESAWQTWQETYSNYILRFARMAQQMDVKILTIGTECKQIVRDRPQFWHSLIKQVKKAYQGKLTYQANWDNFKHVSFWDQLDYISVSGYFPLAEEKQPSEATIAKGWEPYLASLKRMHLAYNKPVIFGEFGYCSKQGALAQPWEGGRQDPAAVNMQVQQKGYQMLFQQVWQQSWFQGGFLWKWYADHSNAGGSDDNRYTPQNKPVEKLI